MSIGGRVQQYLFKNVIKHLVNINVKTENNNLKINSLNSCKKKNNDKSSFFAKGKLNCFSPNNSIFSESQKRFFTTNYQANTDDGEEKVLKKIEWEVVPLKGPSVIKKCPGCRNNNHFISSDKFRVNSNKKLSDVWLIYKCTKCDYTWNMTIFSRINLAKIDDELFDKYISNDAELAMKYSFDTSLMKANGVRTDNDFILNVSGEYSDLMELEEDKVELVIKSDIGFKFSGSKILRDKLSLSNNQIDYLFDKEIIKITREFNLHSSGSDITVLIDLHRLKDYLNNLQQKYII